MRFRMGGCCGLECAQRTAAPTEKSRTATDVTRSYELDPSGGPEIDPLVSFGTQVPVDERIPSAKDPGLVSHGRPLSVCPGGPELSKPDVGVEAM